MPTLHLVVDELVPVDRHRFRVRVWRRADSLPLVLLSQVQGGVPPDWCSSALANLVLRAFPGYSAVSPTFYELSRWDGQLRAFRVSYDTIGCHLRPMLVNPRYDPLAPRVIERVFGRNPDTLNRMEQPRWRVSHRSSSRASTLRPRRQSPESSGI
jgi:hypothetical protein